MRLNIHFSAALIFCLPLLHASAPANADPVSAEIQAGVQELMGNRQKLLNELPNSQLAQQIADILSKAGAELIAYDAQLRPQNLPYNERIAKLRERFMETGKEFDEMERDPNLSETADEVLTYLPSAPKIYTLLEIGQ